MGEEVKILILEDVSSDAELMEHELRKSGLVFTSQRVTDKDSYEKVLAGFVPDLILSDYKLPSFSGAEALKLARDKYPNVPFILVTGALGDEKAAAIIKQGATDYLLKERLSRLPEVVGRALAEQAHLKKLKESQASLLETTKLYENIVNFSPLAIVIHRAGKIIFINPTGLNLIGAKEGGEGLVGKSILDFIRPDYHKFIIDRLKKIRETGQPGLPAEEVYLRLDKTPINVEVATSILTYKGEPAFQSIIIDITERKRMTDALEESENKFKTIADNCPNMIFINVNGRVVYINKKCSELLGYSKEEFLSPTFNFMDLIAVEDRARIAQIYADRQAGKALETYEYKLVAKDGRVLEALNTSGMIMYSGQKALLGIITDFTDRKQLANALKESEEHYRNIVELAPEGIAIHCEGKIVFANSAAQKLLGAASKEELIGKSVMSFVHPDSLKVIAERIKKMLEEGIPMPMIEEKFVRLDGSPIDVETAATPTTYQKKPAVLVVVRDVSERHRAEQSIKESEDKFRKVFDTDPDAISIATLKDGKAVLINKAYEQMIGYSAKEITGKTSFEMNLWANPEDRNIIMALLKEKGATHDFETGIRRKDGTIIWGSMSTLIIDLQGEPHILNIIRDMTERKKREDSLKEALDAKSAFTAMVSHELRTPLGALRESISQLLEGLLGPTNEEQKKFLEIGKRNVDRLTRLIGEVLDFQKLESGKMTYNMQANDINSAIEECEASMFLVAKNKNLGFVLNLDKNLPKTQFDRDKICQVIINLVNNALKSTEKGGITISTIQKDGFIEVSVKDTGIGINKEDIPRLFHKFEQVKRVVGGTGLGLAICRELVEFHDGKIWAESVFGEGTTFYFTLPIK